VTKKNKDRGRDKVNRLNKEKMKAVEKLVKYWIDLAKHDFKTMEGLFRLKRYPDALFYGHMVLEKILKAIVVKNKKKHPQPTHNLLVLLEEASISLTKAEKEFLAEVNKFNIRARYPDYKLSFYKIANLKYTRKRLERIKLLCKKLWQEIKKS